MLIEIYTKGYCPYCKDAITLINAKGLAYKEIEISTNQALAEESKKRSGRRTVPQIFINGHHIGGSDDLADAQANGSLDELIAKESNANKP